MTDQTRTKVIGIFLAGVVLWAGMDYKSSDTEQSQDTLQTIQPLDANTLTQNKSNSFINIEECEKVPWGKSPFYLPTTQTASRPFINQKENKALSWILSGILFNSNSPTAIINKRPVKIGGTIDKAIVTHIEKEKVIIKYKQEEITLTVSKG